MLFIQIRLINMHSDLVEVLRIESASVRLGTW